MTIKTLNILLEDERLASPRMSAIQTILNTMYAEIEEDAEVPTEIAEMLEAEAKERDWLIEKLEALVTDFQHIAEETKEE